MKNFIQWKGTDVCMDFYCACGHHNHYDGYCAYFIKCKKCKKIFMLGDSVQITEVQNNVGHDFLESDL